MKLIQATVAIAAAFALSACADKVDKTVDRGIDSKDISTLEAGIWIDPNGCDHWIIDDGIEGYLSTRLDRYGRPVCSGTAPPNTAVGPFQRGSTVSDPI